MIDFRSGREPKSSNFDFITIRIASPEEIRGPRDRKDRERRELQGQRSWWSWGEVVKPETINYRSFKPEKDGDPPLCMCKRSSNKPYCDGRHARLDADGNLPAAQGDGPPLAVATTEEPTVEQIHELAKSGLEKLGHHGEMVAMGVPGPTLPKWSDIQILAAQFSRKPLLD